jgi:two-component system response regulator DevR
VAGHNQLRVFLVEDSAAMLRSLETLIAEVPEVTIAGRAGTVQAAVEGIAGARPDVVVLDLRLPDGSGLDVMRSIRKNMSSPPAIIVFSSESGEGIRRACLRLGADFVLDKSSEFHRIVEVLQSIIEERGGKL